MLLEYLAGGSLHKVICMAQQQNKRFPDRILWLIFQCRKSFPVSIRHSLSLTDTIIPVIQACVGLEFPPLQNTAINNPPIDEDGRVNGQPVAEAIHGTKREPFSVIHFDIDPQNSRFLLARDQVNRWRLRRSDTSFCGQSQHWTSRRPQSPLGPGSKDRRLWTCTKDFRRCGSDNVSTLVAGLGSYKRILICISLGTICG